MRYELSTEPDRDEYDGDSLAGLAHDLKTVQHRIFVQVWIYKEGGESFGVFFNRDFASIGWMTDDGDSADVYNPDYAGPDDVMQEFYIENGQLDAYPERSCVTREAGLRALLHFFEHGEKPQWLRWQPN